jgi:hypothetical protein
MLPRVLLSLAVLSSFLSPLAAAINPLEFKRIASDVLKLREISRVVHTSKDDVRRVTIVAEIREVNRGVHDTIGQTVVIDYTVDLRRLDQAARDHARQQGNRPGRQFLPEPEPPTLDEQSEFWAHLARAGGRLGNVNRHAGAVVDMGNYDYHGAIYVPVAGPYSWDAP